MGCTQSRCWPCNPCSPCCEQPIPDGVGSRVNIYWQDPSVRSLGYSEIRVPGLKYGPATKDIEIRGINPVRPTDENNNFLYTPKDNPVEFDAVNVVAIVDYILEMYRQALKRLGYRRKLLWQWQAYTHRLAPIRIHPRALDEFGREKANAYYSRNKRALSFFYFRHHRSGKYVYTARCFDVVSHEAGHAILDALKPRYIYSGLPQTGALHESFGDLTAIFGLLEQMHICKAIIEQSRGNLHEKSFLSKLADEFGDGLGRPYGLRNADNNHKIDEVTEEIHDLSRVFTGAIYDIIADVYSISITLENKDSAETLHRVGQHFCLVVVEAFQSAPPYDADFVDLVDAMVDTETDMRNRSIIRRQFYKRKVYRGSGARPKPLRNVRNSAFGMSCGTMRINQQMALMKPVKVKKTRKIV